MAMTMHGKSSALNAVGVDSDIYPDWYDAEHKTGVSIGLTSLFPFGCSYLHIPISSSASCTLIMDAPYFLGWRRLTSTLLNIGTLNAKSLQMHN